MKVPMTALAFVLASMSISGPVLAQDEAAAEQAPQREFDLSKKARKALSALQEAVQLQDLERIPGLTEDARKVLETNDDKYLFAQFTLKAAADQQDLRAMETATDEMFASGASSPEEVAPIYLNLGKMYFNQDDFASADRLLKRTREVDPRNVEALVVMSENFGAQDQIGEAVVILSQAIAEQKGAGQPVDENWYKRAVAWAYEQENRAAISLGKDWIRAYPTEKNWRDAIRIYQTLSNYETEDLIDIMRLQYAVNGMASEADYFRYADQLMRKGFPGEALIALNAALASGAVKENRASFEQLKVRAQADAAGDLESLAGTATKARAAADGTQALTTGDAYYGYGDYANAIDMYRTALTKSGVDVNQVNLRLGMALARSGDAAGARAALGQVTGKFQDIAGYWMVYLDVQG